MPQLQVDRTLTTEILMPAEGMLNSKPGRQDDNHTKGQVSAKRAGRTPAKQNGKVLIGIWIV